LLSKRDRKLLLQTPHVLEELLETEEVVEAKALMRSIRESNRDRKSGRLEFASMIVVMLMISKKPVFRP